MPDPDPIRTRPNCPHCGIAMSIVRHGVDLESVSYQCPWHGRFWMDADGRLQERLDQSTQADRQSQ